MPSRQHRRKHFRVDPNTIFLCHFNKADGTTDFSGEDVAGGGNAPHTIAAAGNAQYDSAQSKWGNSLLLDGTTDAAYAADDTDWSFGTGPLCFEMFMRSPTFASDAEGTYRTLFWMQKDANNYTGMYVGKYSGDGTWKFGFYNNVDSSLDTYFYNTAGITLSDNTWYHVAVSRDGNTWRLFLDGTSLALTLGAGAWANAWTANTAAMYFGGRASGSYSFNGWLDEVRISNVSRYTSNFTPSGPFSP